jgi:hypothetical protein
MQGDRSPVSGSGPVRRAIYRYALAVLAVAAGVLLALLLRPVLDATVLLLGGVP